MHEEAQSKGLHSEIPNEVQLMNMIKEADKNRDSAVDKSEFVAFMKREHTPHPLSAVCLFRAQILRFLVPVFI